MCTASDELPATVRHARADAAELDDLDRLYDTAKHEKGSIDVVWARVWLNELRDRKIRVNVRPPRPGRHRQAGRTIPSALVGMIAPGADVRQRWADAPVSARRITARAMFTPEQLGQIRIVRVAKRGPGRAPARERVTLHRPGAQQAAG